YSTTVNPGLPPTAISNPGRAAIAAALNPPAGQWRYFAVTEENGKSSFAVTLAEHERNVAICRQRNLGC
ncbi:MAG: endolytic transglycosylase MltG, partial [Mycobacteriales bacterium]